jgi:four helix bundle protein
MDENEMKQRTKKFALRVLDSADSLPRSRSGNVIAGQIIRSGTSVAANYRALCRAKSREDFINKTKVVEEEADETSLWARVGRRAPLACGAPGSVVVKRSRRTHCDLRCQSQNRYVATTAA